jgi:predicted peptidase
MTTTANSMDDPRTPGLHKLVFEQTAMRYSLLIPQGYNGETRTPMVLALHYGGVVTPFYGAPLLEQLIGPALSDTGAIIVAPDNDGTGWDNVASETRVMALLTHLFAQYPIDRRRLIVTGYSLGGIGSWYYAARHPTLFPAAIPISGRAPTDLSDIDWRMPLYVIHGDKDDVFPVDQTRQDVADLEERGETVKLTIVEGALHYDVTVFREALQSTIPWIEDLWSGSVSSD